MRTLLLKLEPIIWLMFGQGILLGTMLLTGWILVVGILIPMGIVDASALNYVRAHQIATTSLFGIIPIGKLILAALLLIVIAFGLGFATGGGDLATRSVMGLGTGQRNLSAAFVVAVQNFGLKIVDVSDPAAMGAIGQVWRQSRGRTCVFWGTCRTTN